MMPLRMTATDKSVERGDPVRQSLFEQKFQRPVDRWRCRIETFTTELFQNLVGAEWLVALPDQLQYPLPDRCKANAMLQA